MDFAVDPVTGDYMEDVFWDTVRAEANAEVKKWARGDTTVAAKLREWLNADAGHEVKGFKVFEPHVRRFRDSRKVYLTLKVLRIRIERGEQIEFAEREEKAIPDAARPAYYAMINSASMYVLLATRNPEFILNGSFDVLQTNLTVAHNPHDAAKFVRLLRAVVGGVAHDDFLAWESLRRLEPGRARVPGSPADEVVKYMVAATRNARFAAAVEQYRKVVRNAQYVAVYLEEQHLVSEMTVGLNLNWTKRHVDFWRARVDALHAAVIRLEGLHELAELEKPLQAKDLRGPPPARPYDSGASRSSGSGLNNPVSDPTKRAWVAGVTHAHHRRASRSRQE